MNKRIIIVGIIAFILGLGIGLDLGYSIWKDKIVCNEPYIRIGTNCCLDGNSNNICDNDEGITTITSTTAPIPTTIDRTTSAVVSRVIDGDTIELESGEKVRLLGINTPEMGQPYYEEATNRLKEFVEGKAITLEKDVNDKDQYSRLLRYIYVDDVFVNMELVREGYANVYILPPNTKHEAELRSAWKDCLKKRINLCEPSESYCDERCIGILNFNWNAEGNDCNNLNDEYVVFKNSCSYPCNLTDWTVKDEGNNIYTFPKFTLGEEAVVTLYTGCDINTGTKLYWCSSGRECNAIWDNDGDTLYLRDANGKLIIEYNYEGFRHIKNFNQIN